MTPQDSLTTTADEHAGPEGPATGRLQTSLNIVFVTVAAITVSVLITLLSQYLFTGALVDLGNGIFIAVLVPLIIAPIATYKLFTMVDELRSLNHKLLRMSRLDPLTRILNRREFFDLAESQLQLGIRHAFPIAILMIDFDQFKQVNDKFGHHIGDLVLVESAERMSKLLRDSDIFGRYGGEEFIILLPYSKNPQDVAERIRATMEFSCLKTDKGPVEMTVSIGCATWMEPEETLSHLIDRADTALYDAKATGRNRVAVAVSSGA